MGFRRKKERSSMHADQATDRKTNTVFWKRNEWEKPTRSFRTPTDYQHRGEESGSHPSIQKTMCICQTRNGARPEAALPYIQYAHTTTIIIIPQIPKIRFKAAGKSVSAPIVIIRGETMLFGAPWIIPEEKKKRRRRRRKSGHLQQT